jgi:hypothetical protein
MLIVRLGQCAGMSLDARTFGHEADNKPRCPDLVWSSPSLASLNEGS